MVFVISHFIMIIYAIGSHFTGLPEVFHGAAVDMHSSVQTMGSMGVASGMAEW